MKITPRPIYVEDEIDQSRDVAGFSRWASASRTISFIMFILGWFTIPVEVFLRKDFGQRWFTVVNFYAGLFFLLVLATIQYAIVTLWNAVKAFFFELVSRINPFDMEAEEPTLTEQLMDKSMLFILAAYGCMGAYHLFKIKWRNQANVALHSFDDGTSRLHPLAGWLMKPINELAAPVMKLLVKLIPKKQRQSAPIPRLIHDQSAFANTILEPLLLFYLAYQASGMTSLWLFLSAIALAIHANWRETAKLNRMLDFKDAAIEAEMMRQLRSEAGQAREFSITQPPPGNTINHQPVLQTIGPYPDLATIIDDLNRNNSEYTNR